jgi:hypothetical protein
LRLCNKRGKEKFLDKEILITEKIRTFSRRAHQYICAYPKIAKKKEDRKQMQQLTVMQHHNPC